MELPSVSRPIMPLLHFKFIILHFTLPSHLCLVFRTNLPMYPNIFIIFLSITIPV
jgi:hypothetical protein